MDPLPPVRSRPEEFGSGECKSRFRGRDRQDERQFESCKPAVDPMAMIPAAAGGFEARSDWGKGVVKGGSCTVEPSLGV